MESSGRLARWANVVLGVWLFISAFAWAHVPAQRANAWILGVLFVVFALVAASREAAARWVNTVLAVWLFISVWALPHQSLGTQWNDALVAIAVFLLSLVPERGAAAPLPQHA